MEAVLLDLNMTPSNQIINFQQNAFLIIRSSPNSSCIRDIEEHAVKRIIIGISNMPLANQLANLVIYKQQQNCSFANQPLAMHNGQINGYILHTFC